MLLTHFNKIKMDDDFTRIRIKFILLFAKVFFLKHPKMILMGGQDWETLDYLNLEKDQPGLLN